MCCTIENATNVYCCSGGEVITLRNPDNDVRIVKSEIQSYRPVDMMGPPVEYQIEFMMKNGMILMWTFTTITARNDALANVDNEMTTKDM